MEELEALCEACKLGEIPEALDSMVLRLHNKLHPPGNPGTGVADIQYNLENIVPDKQGGFLILWAEYRKLGWQKDYTSELFVYHLEDGKMNIAEEGVPFFQAAENETPKEVRLLCTLVAGGGGGRTVALDAAATRLGTKIHFETELGEEPPPTWLVQHYNKVSSEVVDEEEREMFRKEFHSLIDQLVMQLNAHDIVASWIEYRRSQMQQATGNSRADGDTD